MSNYKKISELSSFDANEHNITDIVVTVPPLGRFHQLKIGDYTYTDKESALVEIESLFGQGKRAIIIPLK